MYYIFSDIKFLYAPIERLLNDYNGEIFNLGSDFAISILEAAKTVKKCAEFFGFNPEIKFCEERNEAKLAFSNHSKAKKMLDFKDCTDLEKTVFEMFRWALSVKNREIINMNYEIKKNMYSFWIN